MDPQSKLAPMARAKGVSIRMRLREYFLRTDALRQSALLTGPQFTTVRRYHDAALRRVVAAQDLRDRTLASLAISLYREASLLLMVALRLTRDEKLDPASLQLESGVPELDAAIRDGALETPPGYLGVKPLLESSAGPRAEPVLDGEASHAADEFEKLTDWLLEATDVRSGRSLEVSRVVRIASCAALLVGMLGYLGFRILSPKNLALYKPVTATATAYDTTFEGAVDGEKNGTFGYCSIETDSPSLTIDLTRAYALDRIKVYGRGDCCYGQSIPLLLELSDDGLKFRKVGERTEEFTESRPWVVSLPSEVGRYIRLTTQRRSYLVLGEVEAFGRAVP
jgi:hypothetical protein